MRELVLLTIFTILCTYCEKGEFDPNNPNVEEFVQHIKNGTYEYYEKGEDGKNLWLLMPKFSKHHIQSLIDFSTDTSHIEDFPINPLASHSPYPIERPYYILGECLLWTVEGIRNGTGYGSLTPYLIDTTYKAKLKVLNGNEILIVRDLYIKWWNAHKDGNWKDNNPLEESRY